MPPLVRVLANDTTIHSTPALDAELAAQFKSQPAIVLDDLLDPDVQRTLTAIWTAANFQSDVVEKLGSRLLETPPRAGNLLSFLLKREPLCRWLQAVTESRAIATARGSIAQLHAGTDQRLDWHNDAGNDARVLGVTVNLGSVPYQGGRFEMRWRGSDRTIFEHDHRKPGSALVFRIDKNLFHRVTPLSAGGPRTVFSGWFMSA